MSGYALSTESYAFAFPEFSFTNLSSSGIGITSISMNDGSSTPGGLWDYVTDESGSTGLGFTLTQGDRANDSSWHTTIAYDYSGFDAGKSFSFSVDPDTYHFGTGNVVDARPYVFAGGTIKATFSNGSQLTLTWNNPIAHTFDPLRIGINPGDDRNIYYEIGDTVKSVAAVPEPQTYALMLAGLAAVGAVVRRNKSA